MEGSVLRAISLTKRYFRRGRSSAYDFDAVSGVDVSLASGEMAALMGRSGSGKSTLLAMLAGLLVPTSGTVALDGQDLYALDDRRRSRLRCTKLGVVPQGQTPLHALSVLDNVTVPLRLGANHTDAGIRHAYSLLERLGMGELAHAYPAELSGGELRRMAIARSLVASPDVVLADEPTSDLDDEGTSAVLTLMREVADGGAAVLVVTHEHGVHSYADRVLRMDAGSLVD